LGALNDEKAGSGQADAAVSAGDESFLACEFHDSSKHKRLDLSCITTTSFLAGDSVSGLVTVPACQHCEPYEAARLCVY
jgi:hypothetical protein